jgi:stage V sporulation protein G
MCSTEDTVILWIECRTVIIPAVVMVFRVRFTAVCQFFSLGITVQITEVRIKLVTDLDDRLRAFCSITFDGEFVVRDLKVIQGQRGHFVAMPSRKLMEKCVRCSAKNDVKARYCSHCGAALPPSPPMDHSNGRSRMFADIAHPINPHCRERIELAILAAFEEERMRAQQPGYVCRYDEFDDHVIRMAESSQAAR